MHAIEQTCTCLWCRRIPFMMIEQSDPAPDTPERKLSSELRQSRLARRREGRVLDALQVMQAGRPGPVPVRTGARLVDLLSEEDVRRVQALAEAEPARARVRQLTHAGPGVVSLPGAAPAAPAGESGWGREPDVLTGRRRPDGFPGHF